MTMPAAHGTSNSSVQSGMLDIQDISHRFGGLQVLRDVNFSVPAGSLTALIGPNGAGKSTLFNIACGFLLPQQGRVRLEGRDITRDSVQARSHLGLVRTFQTPKVFGKLSVRENLMIGCYRHLASGTVANMLGMPRSHAERKFMTTQATEAARRFGLEEILDRPAGQLPAGMQRMVELARACISRPKFLMLDEPSSGLNSLEIGRLRETLQQLNREGMTLLLVSHDMKLVDVASRVHVLCFGSIIASGDMAQIQRDERVRQAYLGV